MQFLHQQQIPIRPIPRDTADLRDHQALTRALQGASAALILLPFDLRTIDQLESLQNSILKSLEQARPDQFLFLSDYGAHNPESIGIPAIFHLFEKRLQALQIPCTLLRSAEHMQNWLRPGFANFYPPGTAARPFVSAHDVGRIAARLLLDPPSTRIVHVEGPRRYQISELGALNPSPLPPLLQTTYQAHAQGLIEVEPGGHVVKGTTSLEEVITAAGESWPRR